METEKIRVLLQVLELGTLSAAAEKLGYTPSGLSRSIASLEQETGLTLLIRERRGVRPTTACEEMLPSWRRLLAAQEQADQALAALLGLDRGRLRIGSSYGSYLPMLARLVSEFSRQWPGIRVELFEGTSSELGDAVETVQLLPYHNLGVVKWERLGRSGPALEAIPPSDAQMQSLKKQLEDMGVKNVIIH